MELGINLAIEACKSVKAVVVNSTVLGTRQLSERPPLESVRRVVLKRLKENFYCEELTIIPVNILNRHWTLIIVDWKSKCVVKFDPTHSRMFLRVLSHVVKEYISKLVPDQWSLWEEKEDTRYKQVDGFNCGVFVIWFVQSYLQGITRHDTSRRALEVGRFEEFVKIFRKATAHARK